MSLLVDRNIIDVVFHVNIQRILDHTPLHRFEELYGIESYLQREMLPEPPYHNLINTSH